ncbi:hypothetical protein L3070_26355 (plasmid) [Enterobacter cloacae complex sp. ECL405]|nr:MULTISPECIES: hypothetical protein [Enterobacter cloacae complex]MCK6757432.1 hypothetical protein [Enterobacter asburiae]MCM7831866.1 hypothetical protein [Enterobacter asburiae]MDV0706062.1 hypothetical protein [Enterobacter asburiae]UKB55658.1 hypothetical protein L3070_05400 [Enterobacter cloacae complex sp. ECL405]UKB57542.1 hypothetical protein L3070_26710 [Enterobacter cloacae complex sp. ECL405]
MSNITKERVAEFIKNPLDNGLTRGEQMELARIALASLEAEAVGEVVLGEYDDCGCHPDARVACIAADGQADWENFKDGTRLYTAPPAPVSVLDEKQSRELFENWCSVNIERNKWHPEYYAHYPATGQWRAWQACRAAMLQGVENAETPTAMQTAPALDSSPKIAESPTGINQGKSEPVTTANKLPFEQWLSQQTGTIDVECGCVMTEVFFHWLRVAYEAGNSPVIPDGWVLVPVEPTPDMRDAYYQAQEEYEEVDGLWSPDHQWKAMLAAAPQQEA